MAQMKKLNGYEICDQTARNATKNLTGTTGLIHNMFDGNLTSANYVPVFTDSWADGGYMSKQQLRSAMGLGNTLGALPVAKGGTGTDNAAGALANLGAASSAVSQVASSNGLTAFKFNRIVIVHYAGNVGYVDAWTWKLIASDLPKPVVTVHGVAVAQDTPYQTVVTEMQDNGNLYIINKNSSSINTWVFFNLVYVAQS